MHAVWQRTKHDLPAWLHRTHRFSKDQGTVDEQLPNVMFDAIQVLSCNFCA